MSSQRDDTTRIEMGPVDGHVICDFCSDPNPVWKYPATDFQLTEISGSLGAWYACGECHGMIEAGALDALAERSSQAFERRNGPVDHAALKGLVANMHRDFFDHRTGEARKLHINC